MIVFMCMQIHYISDTLGGHWRGKKPPLFLGKERTSKTESQGFKYKPHLVE